MYKTKFILGLAPVLKTNHDDCDVMKTAKVTFPWNLKNGVLFSRPIEEYVGDSWPSILVSNNSKTKPRYVHVTGSKIFVSDMEWLAKQQSGISPMYDSYDEFSDEFFT